MSSHRIAELLRRRQSLVLRSAEMRLLFAGQAQALAPPLALFDRSLAALQWLRRHPEWPLGLMLLVAVIRPRSIVRWSGSMLWGWTWFKRIRASLGALNWLGA